jgi:Cu-Zn family superoxide dismutase
MSALSARPRRTALVAALTLAAGVVTLTAPSGASGAAVSVAGPLTVYAGPNAATGVSAAVHETVTGNGKTIVTLHLSGFGPAAEGQTFGAHAHVNPCGSAVGDAGPHYTHPAAAPTLEDRELWLDFTVNPGGEAHAKATRDWTIVPTTPAPYGARSVIIHALPTNPLGVAGTRLACIDVPFVG